MRPASSSPNVNATLLAGSAREYQGRRAGKVVNKWWNHVAASLLFFACSWHISSVALFPLDLNSGGGGMIGPSSADVIRAARSHGEQQQLVETAEEGEGGDGGRDGEGQEGEESDNATVHRRSLLGFVGRDEGELLDVEEKVLLGEQSSLSVLGVGVEVDVESRDDLREGWETASVWTEEVEETVNGDDETSSVRRTKKGENRKSDGEENKGGRPGGLSSWRAGDGGGDDLVEILRRGIRRLSGEGLIPAKQAGGGKREGEPDAVAVEWGEESVQRHWFIRVMMLSHFAAQGVGGLFGGVIADLIGRKRSCLIFSATLMAVSLFSPFLNIFGVVVLQSTAGAVLVGALHPALGSLSVESLRSKHRHVGMGFLVACQGLAQISTRALLLILMTISRTPHNDSALWTAVVMCGAVPLLVACVVLTTCCEETEIWAARQHFKPRPPVSHERAREWGHGADGHPVLTGVGNGNGVREGHGQGWQHRVPASPNASNAIMPPPLISPAPSPLPTARMGDGGGWGGRGESQLEHHAERRGHRTVAELSLRSHVKLSLAYLSNTQKYIVGSCVPWAIFDFIFYGNGIFHFLLVHRLRGVANAFDKHLTSMVVVGVSFVGYLLAIVMIKKIAPKRLQLLGFTVLAFCYFGLALTIQSIPRPHRMSDFLGASLLYDSLFRFFTFAPNLTAFVVSLENFHTRFRATFCGVSFLYARLGAVLGLLLGWVVLDWASRSLVLLISCVLAILGTFITMMYTPHPTPVRADLFALDQVFAVFMVPRKGVIKNQLTPISRDLTTLSRSPSRDREAPHHARLMEEEVGVADGGGHTVLPVPQSSRDVLRHVTPSRQHSLRSPSRGGDYGGDSIEGIARQGSKERRSSLAQHKAEWMPNS